MDIVSSVIIKVYIQKLKTERDGRRAEIQISRLNF